MCMHVVRPHAQAIQLQQNSPPFPAHPSHALPEFQAVFDNSELDKVRAPRPAGLAILGFKPSSALAAEHTLAPARFIYPDERRLKGSTPAFIALRRALLDQVGAHGAGGVCTECHCLSWT